MNHIEYHNRQEVIARAMQLYGEAAGYNINKALEMLNEPDFEISVSMERFKGLTGSILDEYERPRCPDCDSEMGIRLVPKYDGIILTQVVCMSENCDTVLDSELDINGWLQILKRKDERSDELPQEPK